MTAAEELLADIESARSVHAELLDKAVAADHGELANIHRIYVDAYADAFVRVHRALPRIAAEAALGASESFASWTPGELAEAWGR